MRKRELLLQNAKNEKDIRKGKEKRKMKTQNKKRKGFTLVELLVVIAILAILASVSVVGYLSFTNKAKQSKCETEALQVREVINGTLMDGKELTVGNYTAKLENNTLTLSPVNEEFNDVDTAISTLFTDLAGLNKADSTEFTYKGSVLTYTTDGYKCVITFDGTPLKAELVE